MIDSQFTIAGARQGTILRPFSGFENVYDGQSATIPIVMPGTLDPRAGQPGYSRYLLAGQPCPMGAKALFYFPAVTAVLTIDTVDVFFNYFYVIHWRMRSVGDFGADGLGYQLAQQGFGAQDTLLNPLSPNQVVIPSAVETVLYQQLEPGAGVPTTIGPGLGNLRPQAIGIPNDGAGVIDATMSLPLLPPGSPPYPSAFPPVNAPFSANTTPKGVYSQGLTDLNAIPQGAYSFLRPYFTIAKGNEFMISVNRQLIGGTGTLPTYESVWGFNTSPVAGLPPLDANFSDVYGTNVSGQGNGTHKPFENLGIYAFFGTNPS